MTQPFDFKVVFDALSHPALIVSTTGDVLHANRQAAALLGEYIQRGNLHDCIENDHDSLRKFLRRASGSGQGTIAKLTLRDATDQLRPVRCTGRVIKPRTADNVQALLLIEAADGHERFSVLARQIDELNAEMRKRLRIQALLEESLRERDLLMRELQHRVRNNLQMISGMLTMAKKDAASNEAQTVLSEAAGRINAVAAIQDSLQATSDSHRLVASDFIAKLCANLQQGPLADLRIELDVEPIRLPNDYGAPVALILNELLTHAAKYGRNSPGDPVIVQLKRAEGEVVLTVRDHGSGFELQAERKRSSGLGLVLGLARQVDARFEVERNKGAWCKLRMEAVRSEMLQ